MGLLCKAVSVPDPKETNKETKNSVLMELTFQNKRNKIHYKLYVDNVEKKLK